MLVILAEAEDFSEIFWGDFFRVIFENFLHFKPVPPDVF